MTTNADRATEIVTAKKDDVRTVADTLTDAFYDDPVFKWLCPDDDRRRNALPGWFAVIAEGLNHHRATHVTDDLAGAAVWVPPATPMVDDPEAFSSSLAQVSPPDAERFGTMMALLDEHHPEDTSHWYLFLMGVTTDRQGQGLGSQLLRAVLDECDREGVPAYLEATCERNARLYERHGFEVTRELSLPDGPTGFAMWREPAVTRK